jgi:membrane protease YdiL (CAAX protease family)
MKSSLPSAGTGSDPRACARRGLAVYFAVLVPLSALFEALMIGGRLSWYWALMWSPPPASAAARLLLREGFGDVSFRLGRGRGAKAIGAAVIFPAVVGAIAYGSAWAAALVPFHPEPLGLVAAYVSGSASPLLVFAINVAAAATVVTLFGIRTAAGEEIGWRGYMLTRLIDAGVPHPVLASGLIWGVWHVPLILGGVYLAGPPPAVSALLWMVTATAFSVVFARLRLATGSVWPAVVLHAAWNAIIQVAFDPASKGPGTELWVGESGILVALTMLAAAALFSRGPWPLRRAPDAPDEAGPAPAGEESRGFRGGRLAALFLAGMMAGSLPARGQGAHAVGDAPLPRRAVIPVSAVKAVVPEITREIATGRNETAGKPAATRSVTFANADGSRRIVLSVDRYRSAKEAARDFEEVLRKTRKVPGVKAAPTPRVGQRAFAGVVTRGQETHVGGGALDGNRIITATLQGYAGTPENLARLTALLRRQVAAGRERGVRK